jgi:transposase-like protein
MHSNSHSKTSRKLKSSTKDLCYTIADFNREFPNDDACLEYIKEQRWPNGLTKCEKCNAERKHYHVTGRTAYACDHCGNHVYPLTGTLFAKSTTSLKTWFYVMYLMASTAGAISARRIQLETRVTYKTAWRTLREIRLSFANQQVEPASHLEERVKTNIYSPSRNPDLEVPSPSGRQIAAGAGG